MEVQGALMKTQSGNILLYVMIAILLFSALTFTLMKSGGGDAGIGGRLSGDKAELHAEELIQYANAAHGFCIYFKFRCQITRANFKTFIAGNHV